MLAAAVFSGHHCQTVSLSSKKKSDANAYTTCKQRLQAVHVPHVEGCCHVEQKALQSEATEEQEHGIEDVRRLSMLPRTKETSVLKNTRVCALEKSTIAKIGGPPVLSSPSAALLDPRTCITLSWLCLVMAFLKRQRLHSLHPVHKVQEL